MNLNREKLDKYQLFDETLNLFELENNPLFPVTSEEISEGIKRIIILHQTRIRAINNHLQTRISYDRGKEKYNQIT